MDRDPASRPMPETGGSLTAELSQLGEDLERARELLRCSLHAAPIGMALFDCQGRFLEVNPALCELAGRSEAELLATPYEQFSHPEDVDVDRDLLIDCLAGRRSRYRVEKRFLGAGGRVIEAQISVALIRDGDGSPARFVVQVVDVSELRDARRRAERYLTASGALVVALDTDGRIAIANPALTSALGYAGEDLGGRDWMSLAVTPETREDSRAQFSAVMRGERPASPAYENIVVTASGAQRRVQWTSVVTRDAAGHINGLLKSGLDVTERWEAEQALRRHAEDLAGLRRLAQAVAGSEDPRQTIAEGVRQLAGASVTALFEPIADGVLGVTATTDEVLTGVRVPVGRGSGAGLAFHEARRLFVPDAPHSTQISRTLATRLGVASALYEPIFVDGAPGAVLVVGWRHTVAALDTREADLVAVAAVDIAYAVAHASSLEQLRSEALTDALTGIANRRAFERALDVALADARSSGEALGLALIDLNAFKALNDRAGHDAGDRLLKAAAAAWSAVVRPGDLLARIGGDEFALLLPACPDAARADLPRRLRASLEHDPGCGIGFVAWDFEESAEALLRRADEALYADKAEIKRAILREPERLRAVATALVQARDAEGELRGLTDSVALLLGAAGALLSVVEDQRLHVIARHGALGREEEDVAHAFCRQTVAVAQPVVVGDARHSPLAPGEAAVVAFAGAPLIDAQGLVLGTLCAVDANPRRWSATDVEILQRAALAAGSALARAGAPLASPV